MKLKLLTIISLIILGFYGSSFSQDSKKSAKINSVVWLGVDFTAAKFTDVAEDPTQIVNQYLPSINTLLLTEREKFNVKKFFGIPDVSSDFEQTNEFNKKIDPKSLVINESYKFEADKVKEVIKKYNAKENAGTGLLFVAENLNKTAKSGSYWVCLFDLKSKEIVECKRMTGSVSGIGFRNFWASSVYAVMKQWSK